GYYDLAVNGETVQITSSEVEITYEDIPGWTVASKGPLTVALDTTITQDLREEAIARELVNRLQKIRKEQGFELTDRINVQLEENISLKATIINYNNYICTEILADTFEIVPQIQDGIAIEVNDIKLNVLVHKKQ